MTQKPWLKISLLSTVLVGAFSFPASADVSTYVENDFSIRNIFRGRSLTRINIDRYSNIIQEGRTFSSKYGSSQTETFQSTFGNIDGFKTRQTFSEVDDFIINARSIAKESGITSQTESISVTDSYDFNGIDKTHRVTSGFNF